MAERRELVFSGSSNPQLAQKIANKLGVELASAKLGKFSDGEIRFQSLENVRGEDVFIIQSLCGDINFHIMELLIMADALKRASAKRMTAVLPYYAYARQDRKDRPRVPISAKLLADLLETVGFARILTVDLHANQIQGFFNIPVDNLMALPIFIHYFNNKKLDDMVVVSPDAGGAERARTFARELGVDLAIGDKRRAEANVAEIMNIIGDVKNKVCVIVDDIVDTAGSMTKTVEALKEQGAKEVIALCTHGIFSGKAVERLKEAPLDKIYTTDTIPLSDEMKKLPNVRQISVDELFAQAIESIHSETSVSKLFI